MSGEKYVVARLSEEAQRAIEEEFRKSQQLIGALAEAAGLADEAETLDIERYTEKEITDGFRRKLESATATIGSFRAKQEELRAALNHISQLRQKANKNASDKSSAASARRQAEAVAGELRRKGPEIKELISSISARLDEEQQSEQHRRRMEGEKNRRKLIGLLAELRSRLDPDMPCNLQWVRESAFQLKDRVNALINSGSSVAQDDVLACRKELDDLISAAGKLEYDYKQHRSFADTLAQAFQKAGFVQVYEERRDGGKVIAFQHRAKSQDLHVKVDSKVRNDGHIDLLMQGASGRADKQFVAHAGCSDDLENVIAEAKGLGLIIRNVFWKNPDGGWLALKLRGTKAKKTGQATDEANQFERSDDAKSNRLDE